MAACFVQLGSEPPTNTTPAVNRRDVFFAAVIAVLLVIVAGQSRRSDRVVSVRRLADTVVLRDTVRDTVLIPVRSYIVRSDTVFLKIPGDTVRVEVEVPIERKVYRTDDYMAVVEGFRPRLAEMEVYRQTSYITRTEVQRIRDRQKWGIGVQVGYGYNFDRFYPYVGVGLQYNVVSW